MFAVIAVAAGAHNRNYLCGIEVGIAFVKEQRRAVVAIEQALWVTGMVNKKRYNFVFFNKSNFSFAIAKLLKLLDVFCPYGTHTFQFFQLLFGRFKNGFCRSIQLHQVFGMYIAYLWHTGKGNLV